MNIEVPDFDVLVAMHQHDPDGFEVFRRRLLRAAVDAAPSAHHQSLEQLLDRIEESRAAAATPAEAALAAFCMMRDSTRRLHQGWEQALDAIAGLHATLLIERVRASSPKT